MNFHTIFCKKQNLTMLLLPHDFDIVEFGASKPLDGIRIASTDKVCFHLRNELHCEFEMLKRLFVCPAAHIPTPVILPFDSNTLSIAFYIIDFCRILHRERNIHLTNISDFDRLECTENEDIARISPLWDFIRDDENGNAQFLTLIEAARYLGSPQLQKMLHYQMYRILKNVEESAVLRFFDIKGDPQKEDREALQLKYSYIFPKGGSENHDDEISE